MERILKHKTNIFKDIVRCSCGNREYYGMMIWSDGHQYCRNCTYQRWTEESDYRWKPSGREYLFPQYEDGVNYYERKDEYEENQESA